MKYLPIHFSSSIWLRDDNLWTNLNQFCANIMELIVFITHIWLYGRFYISELNCLLSFSPQPLLRYMGIFHAISVAIVSATANWGRCCEWGGSFIALMGVISIAPSPVNLYCTYTLIISSDCSEALSIKSK